MRLRASIIITTHKRTDLLRWNLQSLFAHPRESCEVLVMDDSHTRDEACQMLAADYGCVYIHSGQTKHDDIWRIPGFAFNIGAKIASGEVLVLSCAEVYHPGDTLGAMLSIMRDDTIAIPRCVRDDKGAIFAQLSTNAIAQPSDIQKQRALDATLPFFMGMKKRRFLDMGGYDEDFTGVCWDDNDLTDRLILSGGKYQVVPQEVVHLHHARHNYKSASIMERWNHNKSIYDARRGAVVRNLDRDWGAIPKDLRNAQE